MNPCKRIRTFGNDIGSRGELLSRYRKIASCVIHFHAIITIFTAAGRLFAFEIQMYTVTRWGELRIGRLFCENCCSNLIKLACFGIIAVVDVHAHDVIGFHEHISDACISVTFQCIHGGRIV